MSTKLESQELNLKMLRVYSQKVLKLKEGQRAVIANGRVLGPLDDDEDFTVEDFTLLERFSSSVYLDGITKALSKANDDDDDDDDGKCLKKICYEYFTKFLTFQTLLVMP